MHMQKLFKTEEEYKRLKKEGRLIILNAALDSTCYFLTPNCNKCTYAVYVASSKKCMYNLKTEMCYLSESIPDFDDASSLGRPEKWEVRDTIITIYYNKLFSGKFGRSIFTNKEKAEEVANMLNIGGKFVDNIKDSDFININYMKLAEEGRIVVLPCCINDSFYTIEPDCKVCKYKNNEGFQGCNYEYKKGVSPYTCDYYNSIQKCRIYNQRTQKSFYFTPTKFEIRKICMLTESVYDLYRNSPHSDNHEAISSFLKQG